MIDEMKGKQKREKSYKKWGRKGDKMLRREEGLGEGKGKRAEEVTEAKERKKEVTEGERKITRETEVRQNISDTDRRGSEEEEKRRKQLF